MSGNSALHRANKAKADEFYTQLSDIEKELRHYKHHFKDKVVFCNCDNPYESNFFKYFVNHFNHLGLKRLIATCYGASSIESSPYKVIINNVEGVNNDGAIGIEDIQSIMQQNENTVSLLEGDGDFRSEECIELLKQADIVVTNPPFSLFREYIGQLVEYDKKFLVIGSQNAIGYKDIFPLIDQNKLWVGYNYGSMEFQVPDYYEPRKTGFRIDENGIKWRRLGNICWFTNLDIEKRYENIILYKTYNEEEYPGYDNYDAINVNKVSDIPVDYDGVMGVPITFINKYNPDQFEIVAFRKGNDGKDLVYSLAGKQVQPYSRVLVRRI